MPLAPPYLNIYTDNVQDLKKFLFLLNPLSTSAYRQLRSQATYILQTSLTDLQLYSDRLEQQIEELD